jgi:hypothetical protein
VQAKLAEEQYIKELCTEWGQKLYTCESADGIKKNVGGTPKSLAELCASAYGKSVADFLTICNECKKKCPSYTEPTT